MQTLESLSCSTAMYNIYATRVASLVAAGEAKMQPKIDLASFL